ncbi:hypothetical protein [Mesobacillus jeotgali]|uniref:Uncharacterized protein n=1 Tax=Mesobacillus jeotgali TaxID=129985 RepID=A0ABY9VKF5_9BACI|nr:hypothetical protein [Mesobacillus jeotgali]WNF23624.1 hypothetical protein RH061_03685 [Mesobacillus jeotgali]
MFYQDYQALAQLKQQEVERKARHAWKFYEQPETKQFPLFSGNKNSSLNAAQFQLTLN